MGLVKTQRQEPGTTAVQDKLLKKDLFGEVRVRKGEDGVMIVRDASCAALLVRPIANRLLRREARVLAALDGLPGVPELKHLSPQRLARTYIEGLPLQEARTRDPVYFRAAARLLRLMHRKNIVHNDLAKEPNLLVQPGGLPAFIDFQLAWAPRQRNRLFRVLAYEDVRHLLKHKRTYCPAELTARERRILANPSRPSRIFRQTVKPAYLFVTRRLLGWADREGAGDRGRMP